MRTLITGSVRLGGLVQAPGVPTEDTDGGSAHGGRMAKYLDPEEVGAGWRTSDRRS